MTLSILEKRIRKAGILIVIGLLIELATLYSARPTAFLTFIFLGGLCLASGILLFLYSLVAPGKVESKESK